MLRSAAAVMAVETEILVARLTRIKTALDAIEPVCLASEAARDTFLELKQELESARDTFLKLKEELESGTRVRPDGSTDQAAMAQQSDKRRFHFFWGPSSRCPLCKCPLGVISVGQVDDVGFFRCGNCDEVFTMPGTTARATVTYPRSRPPLAH